MVSERRAFGDRARRQRERRGVTLEAIAQATKVSVALFAGLERGDCSRWPGGVYGRAYVRAYAEAIGLDPNEAVEDFTAAFGPTVWPDGAPGAPGRRLRATSAPRLSMDDEPNVRHTRFLVRAALAGADLAVVFAIAWLAQVGLGTPWWTTVAAVTLVYHGAARLLTDQPLGVWVFGRFRTAPPSVDLSATEDVSVTDPASTTA